jgi:hypothetical protein
MAVLFFFNLSIIFFIILVNKLIKFIILRLDTETKRQYSSKKTKNSSARVSNCTFVLVKQVNCVSQVGHGDKKAVLFPTAVAGINEAPAGGEAGENEVGGGGGGERGGGDEVRDLVCDVSCGVSLGFRV